MKVGVNLINFGPGATPQALTRWVRRDLEALHALGCTYVLLDTFYDDVEATRHHEIAWRMLITMAEKALDLPHETRR
jgi:hypothetical protein